MSRLRLQLIVQHWLVITVDDQRIHLIQIVSENLNLQLNTLNKLRIIS